MRSAGKKEKKSGVVVWILLGVELTESQSQFILSMTSNATDSGCTPRCSSSPHKSRVGAKMVPNSCFILASSDVTNNGT